jgi:hypothetical protein
MIRMRKWYMPLIGMVLVSCVGTSYGTRDTVKVYDKNWNLKGYVQDCGNGVSKIYNANWSTKGFMRGVKK